MCEVHGAGPPNPLAGDRDIGNNSELWTSIVALALTTVFLDRSP